jgi:hypothetical protein
MGYTIKSPPFDPARAEERKAQISKAVPLTTGDAAFLHLTKHRGINPVTILGCADLRMLPPPIIQRPATDFGLISLLRPTAPDAEVTGVEIAFVDRAGAKSAKEPNRICWSFVKGGCRNAWFWAGGEGDRAVAAEGFGAKPLALLSAGVPGVILGWGSRSWLRGKKLPASIKRMVIFADRAPAPDELDEDGRPSLEGHKRDYQRAVDFWLLELGDGAVRVAHPEALR